MSIEAVSKPLDVTGLLGVREPIDDIAAPGPVAAMSALLDKKAKWPRVGDVLPAGWHGLFFWDTPTQSELGPDGLSDSGRLIVPVPATRRMFAGARVRCFEVIRIGDQLRCEPEVKSVVEKQGRSGHLVFVTISQRIFSAGRLAIEEELDFVYLAAAPAARAHSTELAWQGVWTRTVRPDPVMLFRFAALTFNSHRIHYDRNYTESVEGYDGLVVQSPLIVLMLLDLCQENLGCRRIVEYRFQGVMPLVDTAPFVLIGRPNQAEMGVDLAATDTAGRFAVKAFAKCA